MYLDDAELARLEHANLIGALSAVCGYAPEALIRRVDGVALILTGLPLRLFNQILVADDGAADEAVAAAVAVARDRGVRFVVNLRDGIDTKRTGLIERLGLVPISDTPWMPGMALYPIPASTPPTLGDAYEIRQVTDEDGVDDHNRTAGAGFELPEAIIRAVTTTALARRPDAALYVGYRDGEAVTTGLGFRTDRTIGVYNISTVPAARGRGYGAAMTTRVAQDGAAAGCETAILQASDMGFPIYERMGYRTVVEYRGYIDPDAAAK